jgi:HD-GYP domain-containing protein (c-di-GMP phosphodiesterase class II)
MGMSVDQSPEEDKDLKAILEMNLDGLDSLGIEDNSFRAAPESLPMTLERRMGASPRLARLQEMWDKGEPGDAPGGLPLSRGLEQINVAERTLTYKATLLKTYESSVSQVKEVYDLICLGEIGSMSTVRTLVGSFLDFIEKDRNALLAICLYQSPSLGDYLYRHAVNMCVLSLAVATSGGFSRGQVMEIGQGALLADVGMTTVPESIRLKAGKLTEQELAEIHKHPATGFAMLEKIQGATDIVVSAAYQHHERLSGAGYPKRRAGAQISNAARITGIADTLCAMVHKRSHREALTPHAALDKVIKMAQMNFLDANLVKALLRYVSVYPIGSFVELSSGRLCRVVEAHVEDPTRPIVSVLRNEKGQPLPMRQILQVDLLREKNEKVVKVLEADVTKFKHLDGF